MGVGGKMSSPWILEKLWIRLERFDIFVQTSSISPLIYIYMYQGCGGTNLFANMMHNNEDMG